MDKIHSSLYLKLQFKSYCIFRACEFLEIFLLDSIAFFFCSLYTVSTCYITRYTLGNTEPKSESHLHHLHGTGLPPLILSLYCMQGGFNQANIFM